MQKGLILISIVFLILIIGSIAYYLLIEKPKIEELEKDNNYNITLKYIDFDTKVQLEENYVISLDNNLFLSGRTDSTAYTFLKIPINHSFSICSNSTNYYNTCKEFNNYNYDDILNTVIELNKLGNLTISHSGRLLNKEDIVLNVESKGLFKCMKLCFRIPPHLLYIKPSNVTNFTITNIPLRLKDKVDNCYTLNSDLNGALSIPLIYNSFGSLTENDVLKVYFVDGDDSYYSECLVEDRNNNDVGLNDIIYTI